MTPDPPSSRPARLPSRRDTTVRQGDRLKAYRPLPAAERRRAFEAALDAYGRGDFFEAHERLEPAWMGTDDLAERALHQGLIKLAAAYVHAVRGNRAGVAKNLAGARRHLALAGEAAIGYAVDVEGLARAVDRRLAALGRAAAVRDGGSGPIGIQRPPRIRRTMAA